MVSSKLLRLGSCLTLHPGRWNQPAWPAFGLFVALSHLFASWICPLESVCSFFLFFHGLFIPNKGLLSSCCVSDPWAQGYKVKKHRQPRRRSQFRYGGNTVQQLCYYVPSHTTTLLICCSGDTGKARMFEFVSVWGTLLVKLGSPREGRKVWEGKEGQGRSCWMCEERILEGTQKHSLSRTQQYLGGWG